MHTSKMHVINMRKKGFVFFALFSAIVFTTSAQDSLTVEEAVAYALRNNYDILLARQDSSVAAINYDYRNAAFYPQINATGSTLFSSNNQKIQLADGTERVRNGIKQDNLAGSINLNWTLFDGFRMFLLRDQLNVAINQGALVIKSTVVNTISVVITTYYDIVRQKQQLRNVEEQLQLAADRLRLAQYRFDVGAGIKPDVLQAKIDYNNSTAAKINQLALIDQRRQTLNQLMNVTRNADYKVSDTIPVQTNLVLGDLLNNIALSNPELQLARINIQAAELNVRLAKTARYPTVQFVSAYNFTRNAFNQVINPFSPLFNLNRGWNYGLTVNIPILNNFTVRQQIRQAELAFNFEELAYRNQETLLNTNLLNAYRNYTAQLDVVATLDSSVGLARENLFIEQERYRIGRTTYIELRQAEENVSTILTNLINARYNLKVAETELRRLRGELVR